MTGRIWKEVVTVYFTVLFQHFLRGTAEDRKTSGRINVFMAKI
jgi:hypothetical protein